MSHNDPYRDLSASGAPGDPARRTDPGTARVESRLTGSQGAEPTGGAYPGGSRDEGLVGQAADRARDAADEVRDRAEEWTDDAREHLSEWTDRAGEYASRARDEISGALERAEDQLEEQTGAISMARNYPLAAAGLAFGVGFLLAGGDDDRKRSSGRRRGMVGRAGGQLRKVVIGSVSTLLMQQLQELLDEHGGPAGLLQSITGRGSEPEPR